MQLKHDKGALRRTLALAACALAGGSHPASAASQPWSLDSAVLFYNEVDRVSVVEPVVFAKRELADGGSLGLHGLFDTMSGASPNGAVASNRTQTFTSPSGNSTYSAAPGATPMRSFRDQRLGVGLDWMHPLGRLLRSNLSATLSSETDYFSLGLGDTLSLDSADRLTTWSLGAALSLDQVQAEGGAPDALTLLSAPATAGGGGDESKTVTELQLGLTQVLTRSALLQANLAVAQHSGYLTDPYKILSVVDASGATVDYRYEKRPDSRQSQVAYIKWVQHLDEDVFHLSYRYYSDDWGIDAHTLELNYRYELGGGRYLMPHIRAYTQTAADFHRYFLVQGEALPSAASADLRLGAMDGRTLGLKYAVPAAHGGELSLRVEWLQQSGEGHPAEAFGTLRSYDLYPTLNAYIVQFGYSTPL